MHNSTDENKTRFHIGMRNIKTGLAVFLCLALYNQLGRDGYFLAATSAIICMQDSVEKSVSSGLNRLLGTAFGALLGMGLLYLNLYFPYFDLTLLSATLGTVLTILFCNIIRQPDSIVIGCVVLLIIVLEQTNQTPLMYSVDRLIDTFVGIFVAILVNRYVRNPARKRTAAPAAEAPDPVPPPEAPAEPINKPDDHNKDEEGTV